VIQLERQVRRGESLPKTKPVISILILICNWLLPTTASAASDSKRYQIHYALFKIYQGQRQLDLASAELQELIKLRPNEPSLHGLRGRDLFAASDWNGALTEFLNAVKFDPSNPDYWGMIGHCYLQLGRTSEALDAFNKTHGSKPYAR
jgi:tetratricopeptide (TPR) repeat protein